MVRACSRTWFYGRDVTWGPGDRVWKNAESSRGGVACTRQWVKLQRRWVLDWDQSLWKECGSEHSGDWVLTLKQES